ncbi:hypothetical protein IJG14_08130 [bacterium]|nr:hypothetical protein [bacterium]
MYINKCTKCGAEFETKNPKRVICPNCLYPERKQSGESGQLQPAIGNSVENSESNYVAEKPEYGYSSAASFGGNNRDYERYDRNSYNNRYDNNYQRPQRNHDNSRYDYGNRPQRNYGNRPQRSFGRNQNSGYGNRPQRSFNRNQNNGYGNNRRNNSFNKRSQPKQKQLLISKEQLEQIELIYKKALPLPNHDIHEVIGTALGIEPRKVFFGINLVRQKMMLPKLQFPKRKLAVTPDQLTAIKMLYEPLLPLPPIGCHKLIALQLKMDEWRVHVGIGLIRKEMGLDRWNPDRPDAPKEYKK